MKLTEDILHGLIKEMLENYSKSETKFFGKGIAEIIEKGNDVYKNEKAFLDAAWIVKNVGPRIGAGYSREVYQIGDSNMVIKFALPEELKEGIQSNGFEVELFNQYPFVFPRTYIFDKSEGGPEWLVIEKVTVIENGFEYDEIVSNCFPSLVRAAKMFVDAGYDKIDPSFLFERLLDSFEESEGSDVMGLWMDIIFHARRLKGGDEEVKKKLAEESWAVATNDANLMKFITTMLDLGVDFEEIREGNIGTNDEKNKLMLIDISKFQFVEG